MADKYPNVSGFTEGEEISWSPNTGDVKTLSWDGSYDDVYNTFIARRAAAPGTADVFSLTFRAANGRASLVEQRTRDDGNLTEEIIGIDVMKDVLSFGYFSDLTNDEVVDVRTAYEENLKEGEGVLPSGGFTGKQGTLYFHLIHGVETLPETAWIFSRVQRAVRFRAVGASFSGVNQVDTTGPQVESSSIQKLVSAIPAGEWLKKPPRVVSAGKGKYDVAQEWWYAVKWSVALGGTFGAPP